MNKIFLFSAVIIVHLFSCKSIRTLEGRAKPVDFTADPAIFSDTLTPVQEVYQRELLGLTAGYGNVELFKGETSKTFIHAPTLFEKGTQDFLVYPGEHIFIEGEPDNYKFTTVNGKIARDRELLVLKEFQRLEQWPRLRNLVYYTLQDVLELEQERIAQINKAEEASQLLFDSLCKTYQVSRDFKKLTKYYVHDRYGPGALWVYRLYRDTLLAYNLYWSKIKALLPEINGITKPSEFSQNKERHANDLYSCLFPLLGIWNMQNEAGFRERFDSVGNNFKGMARDYLLSRIMYRASEKGIKVPREYRKKYLSYSINKKYRKIVSRTKRKRKRLDRKETIFPNELLLADGRSKTTLETVLQQCKGKYVLIDLWASWCPPCRQEMPYLEQLKEKYEKTGIAFIRISTESSSSAWRKCLYNMQANTSEDYLLLNSDHTAFCRQINLETIPRYLVFDKDGKMINNDAPRPSDPELEALLKKLISNNN